MANGMTTEEELEFEKQKAIALYEWQNRPREFTKAEAVGAHLPQGMTFGLGDEASAGLELGIGRMMDFFKPEGEKVYEGETYESLRDENRAFIEGTARDQPGTALTADIAGSFISTAPAAALTAAKAPLAAAKLARYGRAGKIGASLLPAAARVGTGLLEGGLRSYGEDEVFMEGAKRGLYWGTGAEALPFTIKQMTKLGRGLASAAETTVMRNLAFDPYAMRKMRDKSVIFRKAKKIARQLLDLGIGDSITTAKGLHGQVSLLMHRTGRALRPLYRKMDELFPGGIVTPDELRYTIGQAVKAKKGFPSQKALMQMDRKFDDLLGKLPQDKRMTFTQLWEFRKEIDSISRKWTKPTASAYNSAGDMLSDASSSIQAGLESLYKKASPELADDLVKHSRLYHQLSLSEEALANKVIKTVSKNKSLPRRGVGETALDYTFGSTPAMGAYAKVLDKSSKIFKFMGRMGNSRAGRMLQEAQRRGGHALAATHFTLVQQDPTYKKAYEKWSKTFDEKEKKEAE